MAISFIAAHSLIKNRDESSLRVALEAGLNPNLSNHHGWSLLMLAAVEGSVRLGNMLLEYGANPVLLSIKRETAQSIATKRSHTDFVELLNNQFVSNEMRVEAEDRRHEAYMDKLGAKLAKEMGPVHIHMSGIPNDPLVKVANEVFRKAALRKVN